MVFAGFDENLSDLDRTSSGHCARRPISLEDKIQIATDTEDNSVGASFIAESKLDERLKDSALGQLSSEAVEVDAKHGRRRFQALVPQTHSFQQAREASAYHQSNQNLKVSARDTPQARVASRLSITSNAILSPLLGRFTAKEFHKHLMNQICSQCEREQLSRGTQSLIKYHWKNRKYAEYELFPPSIVEGRCEHQRLLQTVNFGKPNIVLENLRERLCSLPKQENVFWHMTGRMSAAGKLGIHKYESPRAQSFGSRAYFIASDIKNKRDVEREQTKKKLETLELQAINRPKGRLRPVLNKGLYKFQPWDFKIPQDVKARRAAVRQKERTNRLEKFEQEMDNITF